MTAKLEVQGLRFGYNNSEVLKGIDFKAMPGRLLSLVGPNGSGKSTLLRCMNNILTPSQGLVAVDGREVRSLSRMEAARIMSYVPQSIHRVFPHSVFDVVAMGRRPHLGWRGGGRDKEKVWEVLDRMGLVELAMNPFTRLSGGQQQKVLIARTLVQETGLILLDEPTSNLDIWHQLDVLNVARTMVEEKGVTVIMAMHDLNLAARYSHDLLMLKDGQVVMTGGPEDVLTRDNIADVYNVDSQVREHDGTPYVVHLRQRSVS